VRANAGRTGQGFFTSLGSSLGSTLGALSPNSRAFSPLPTAAAPQCEAAGLFLKKSRGGTRTESSEKPQNGQSFLLTVRLISNIMLTKK
jgi:hypothetical protein